MQTFLEEESELFESFLNNHIFSYFKEDSKEKYVQLELIVTPICNTKCEYCYYKNFSDHTYPSNIINVDTIVNNCSTLIEWLEKKKLVVHSFSIFSGEFFNFPRYKEIIELINSYANNLKEKVVIDIPTNSTFCFYENRIDEIQKLLNTYNGKSSYTKINLSLSCDGKYLDNLSRPLRNGKQYDDNFYDNLFKFAAKNNFSFHPMISNINIDEWPKNFDWFITNICKYYHISPLEALNYIYLLEVRNPDWTASQLESLKVFIDYIVQLTYKICNNDKNKVFETLFTNRKLNFFGSLLVTKNFRGIGCSIQTSFCVRLGDLAIVPCHRTAWEGLEAGFIANNLDIKSANIYPYMLIQSLDFTKAPTLCANCDFNTLCASNCIGCNYEVNHDLFSIVPSVCRLEKIKLIQIIESCKKLGILDLILKSFEKNTNYFTLIKSAQIKNIANTLNLIEKDI